MPLENSNCHAVKAFDLLHGYRRFGVTYHTLKMDAVCDCSGVDDTFSFLGC